MNVGEYNIRSGNRNKKTCFFVFFCIVFEMQEKDKGIVPAQAQFRLRPLAGSSVCAKF